MFNQGDAEGADAGSQSDQFIFIYKYVSPDLAMCLEKSGHSGFLGQDYSRTGGDTADQYEDEGYRRHFEVSSDQI